MTIIRTASLDDAKLQAFIGLTDAQLRSKLEPEEGILIAESANVALRALDAGLIPLSALTSEGRLHVAEEAIAKLADRYASMDEDSELSVFVLPDDQFESLTGYRLTRGLLVAFRRPQKPTMSDVLKGTSRICVLEDITNNKNVGAIFRSAAALGIDAVLVGPGCCDPYHRRAARVSMGAVFQVPWTRFPENTVEGIAQLKSQGFLCAAMALVDDSASIDDPRLEDAGKLALFFGTEGEGLSPKTISACDISVRIPMQNGVDSLNVAAASAVAFWQTRKR